MIIWSEFTFYIDLVICIFRIFWSHDLYFQNFLIWWSVFSKVWFLILWFAVSKKSWFTIPFFKKDCPVNAPTPLQILEGDFDDVLFLLFKQHWIPRCSSRKSCPPHLSTKHQQFTLPVENLTIFPFSLVSCVRQDSQYSQRRLNPALSVKY